MTFDMTKDVIDKTTLTVSNVTTRQSLRQKTSAKEFVRLLKDEKTSRQGLKTEGQVLIYMG